MRSIAIAVALAALLAGCGGASSASQSDKDKAIAAAKFLYAGKASQSYRDGQTHHFVELTPSGQLIRAE
jgi:hypothetical protein